MRFRHQVSIGLIAVMLTVLLVGVSVSYADPPVATYRVTITNQTTGQPFSPVIAATTFGKYGMFKGGKRASPELEAIAETGNNGPAYELLTGQKRVTDVVADDMLVGPGDSRSFEIKAGRRDRLSLATMLVCTNDAFTALHQVRLPRHGSKEYHLKAYDAGTEQNTESSEHVPCLGGDGEDSDIDTNERISRHPGIQGGADLDPASHGWTNPVAKVTVERIN